MYKLSAVVLLVLTALPAHADKRKTQKPAPVYDREGTIVATGLSPDSFTTRVPVTDANGITVYVAGQTIRSDNVTAELRTRDTAPLEAPEVIASLEDGGRHQIYP